MRKCSAPQHISGVSYADSLKELWSFIRRRRRTWLVPVLAAAAILGALLLLAESSAVAPLIYTLF